MSTTTLQKDYKERIVPALTKEFNYSTVMQVPRLEKIVINQGLGAATQDKKLIDTAINELTAITGQKAVQTLSKKDISNFKLRKKMPVGVRVTLRRERMYEFLERLVRVALPRIRDFKGIDSKLDGRGNYTLGITEQIIFPEINIDTINKLQGMNITFVTTANTDEEGYALLKEFGLPFKNAKKLPDVVKALPNDRLLLETDAPYLTPVPYRSKTNNSAMIFLTAQKIAEIKNTDTESILRLSKQNAEKLFNIKV